MASVKPKTSRPGARDPYYNAKQQLEVSVWPCYDSSASVKYPCSSYDVLLSCVQDKVMRAQSDFEQWRFILDNKNTSTDPNFDRLNKGINVTLKELNVDLRNLQQVITVVEKSRQTFAHIDDAELAARKSFIADTRNKVQNIENVVNSDKTRLKIQGDQRRDLMGSSDTSISQGRGGARITGEVVVAQRRQDMKAREEEQDAVLEDMSSALDRLTTSSTTINTKLYQHQELIAEMDTELDRTRNLMDTSLEKMDKLLAKNRGGRLCCIVWLAVVVIILFMLIIYT